MADYLSPNDQLTTDDQKLICQMRSQSNPLPATRGEAEHCVRGCGKVQSNCHIIQCSRLNQENKGTYILLDNGTIYEMKNYLE